jgi:hypothetical protein
LSRHRLGAVAHVLLGVQQRIARLTVLVGFARESQVAQVFGLCGHAPRGHVPENACTYALAMTKNLAFKLGARVRVTAEGDDHFGEAGELVDFDPINDGQSLAHVKLDDGPTLLMQTGQLEVIEASPDASG